MLVTFYDTVEGINLLKNKDLINKVKEIKNKYNVDEKTLLSILKEFSIGVSSHSDVHQIAELLDKGKNIFSISTQLECTEFHVKNIIRRSPQMQSRLESNNAEFNFVKKYGEHLYNEVKALEPPINFSELVGIPLPIFAHKSPSQLVALGIPESKIEENFIKLGRSMDFVAYKSGKKLEHIKEKLKDPHNHIRTLYENGDGKITLRYLSEQFQISYSKLCTIKRFYNWKKKNTLKTKKEYQQEMMKTTPQSNSKNPEVNINHKLNKMTKLYINGDNSIYGLSKRYKMSVLSVVSIIKANFKEFHLDESVFKKNLLSEVAELFIEAKLPIDKIITIFDISVYDIHEILENYIGTIPHDIIKYTDSLFTYNWTEFQIAFLDSDLSDKELSQFLSIPSSIIQAKRKDLKEGRLDYFRKHKNWLVIYNKLMKEKSEAEGKGEKEVK